MTHTEICNEIGIKTTQWHYVRKGNRNLSYKRATKAAEIFHTSIDVWMDQEKAGERVAAIDRLKAA